MFGKLDRTSVERNTNQTGNRHTQHVERRGRNALA